MKKKIIITCLLSTLIGQQAYAADDTDVQLKNSDKVKTNEAIVEKSTIAVPTDVPAFKARKYKGKIKNENVLVVLMDFTDSKHSTLVKENPGNPQWNKNETMNFYDDYTKAYYHDMLFGEQFTGSNGQLYDSMKKYYQQSSGGSLNLKGQVIGWYRAAHPLTYYGKNGSGNETDLRAGELVMEAARKAAKDPSIRLKDYDQYDYYDSDFDGNTHEPDGIIDKLVVIFSGIGESQGGGSFRDRSIWEHVSEVPFDKNDEPQTIKGTYSSASRLYNKRLGVSEYGLLAEDSAVGTFSHEFGHMLGLIDEYDTDGYSAMRHAGEPVRYWSLMSYGADAGNGMMPTGLSPLAKSDLQQLYGGNWALGTEINMKDITSKGKEYLLDQASIKGVNNDLIRINLPQIKKKNKNGKITAYDQYYLVEWRSHNGVDRGLGEIYDPVGRNQYGQGMLVWYINESYKDNSKLSSHFGRSLIGVVDANRKTVSTIDGGSPGTDVQMYDAAFNTKTYGNYNDDFTMVDTQPVSLFSDKNYTPAKNSQLMFPESGRILPQYGLKIKVLSQNADGTVAKIKIYK